MFHAIDSSLILISILSHISVLALLSIRRSQLPPYAKTPLSTPQSSISTTSIRCLGLLSATTTFLLPYVSLPDDPYWQSAARGICFFYACKLLDLCIAKAHSPPSRLQFNNGGCENQKFAPMTSWSDHIEYVYLLLTEMRYPSFDTLAKQEDRPDPSRDGLNSAWSWMPPIIIVIFAFLLPIPESICLLILITIQFSFEALHTILHFARSSCTQPLFYKPFAANSLASFWATHWHAAAAPFLQTLGYRPGRRYVGKWFGVLATFNVTGLWHAWAVVPYVEYQSRVLIGSKVWAVFMMWGLGILVERWVWGERQGDIIQRTIVWSFSMFIVSWCARSFQCYTNLDWLRADVCS